jgi:hypothetical protein
MLLKAAVVLALAMPIALVWLFLRGRRAPRPRRARDTSPALVPAPASAAPPEWLAAMAEHAREVKLLRVELAQGPGLRISPEDIERIAAGLEEARALRAAGASVERYTAHQARRRLAESSRPPLPKGPRGEEELHDKSAAKPEKLPRAEPADDQRPTMEMERPPPGCALPTASADEDELTEAEQTRVMQNPSQRAASPPMYAPRRPPHPPPRPLTIRPPAPLADLNLIGTEDIADEAARPKLGPEDETPPNGMRTSMCIPACRPGPSDGGPA